MGILATPPKKSGVIKGINPLLLGAGSFGGGAARIPMNIWGF